MRKKIFYPSPSWEQGDDQNYSETWINVITEAHLALRQLHHRKVPPRMIESHLKSEYL